MILRAMLRKRGYEPLVAVDGLRGHRAWPTGTGRGWC